MAVAHDDPLRSSTHAVDKDDMTRQRSDTPATASNIASPAPALVRTPTPSGKDPQVNQPQATPSPMASRMSGPRSSYYTGPPAKDSAFGTPPVGVIGRDKPREIVRVERDYSGGELCQFHPTFPLELEGRISPTLFSETINDINVIIIDAYSAGWACLDNTLAVLSLYTSPFIIGSKYRREMKKLDSRIEEINKAHFNPAGLNLRKPIETAFLFLEVEYY